MLLGRTRELAKLEGLLRAARSGRGGGLVLRGEAGIGKTTLLDHLATTEDLWILRAYGSPYESGLPYAGLHLLLRTIVHRIDALPPRQGRALSRAFGLSGAAEGSARDAVSDGTGDGLLVGLAVLTLLSGLADEQPVLCLVDDAHWLDPASAEALLFAARRLEADRVAMVFAVREPHAPEFASPGLADLPVGGLDDRASAQLLGELDPALPPQARAEILREARGNPLALRELPAVRGTGLIYDAAAPPAVNRVQRAFAERIAALPARTQTVLLVAAAADTGMLSVVLDAAAWLGASVEDLVPAERADLVRLAGERLTFRHPLIQATVYQQADAARRLAVHRALAEALIRHHEPGRRAWHLAAASTGPDEDVAAALEHSAEEARRRGGYLAVARTYERAAALTPDRSRRGLRLAAAARAAADAGRLRRAASLLEEAAVHLTGPALSAEVAGLDALLDSSDGRQAHRRLIHAAGTVAERDPQTAGRLLFNAVERAWSAGDLAAVADAAHRTGLLGLIGAEAAGDLARAATAFDRLAVGGTAADGVAALRNLVATVERDGPPRHRAMVVWWHVLLGDFATAQALAADLERDCRLSGAIGVLPEVLALTAIAHLHFGRHAEALTTAGEGLRLARDTGQPRLAGGPAIVLAQLAAIEGDARLCHALLAEAEDVPHPSLQATRARNLIDLAQGRPDAVLDRLPVIAAGLHRMDARAGLSDVVEAAVRAGRPQEAREPFQWYLNWAIPLGRPWAEAIAARCAALLDDDAEPHYLRALRLHRERDAAPFERARTELLYGEWLRRAQRRADARAPLRSASETFERLAAHPWADRARAELRATGESRATPAPDPLAELTPREQQIARLAATGLSNQDIAARLFLSSRTVGYHLSNTYRKLGLASRTELARLVLDDNRTGSV
ncbi:AAA family ATPase [Nonomuraea sp. GTA35]|uniref:ATP-binding protein n=1 Tax=Nonomuraea sp. GTA35 TaxID=1676746 RepID=UPI0035BF8A77